MTPSHPTSRPPTQGPGPDLRITSRERRDLLIAWLALGLAFTLFIDRRIITDPTGITLTAVTRVFLLSLLTVGIGFLLHELAHKIVAVRFGQSAEFRADYGMLGLAIASGIAGFLFAAPGAVYHRGYITTRENGLIALAGPVTNLILAVAFLPLAFFPGFIGALGNLGVVVNLFLAAFNMLPVGPLDGRKVYTWNPIIFVLVFLPSAALVIIWFLA